jgi:hypothetical protein
MSNYKATKFCLLFLGAGVLGGASFSSVLALLMCILLLGVFL